MYQPIGATGLYTNEPAAKQAYDAGRIIGELQSAMERINYLANSTVGIPYKYTTERVAEIARDSLARVAEIKEEIKKDLNT